MTKKREISYEEAMDQVKEIVAKIERGDSKVDELSAMVEKALGLIQYCKDRLRNTENNIQNLFDDTENENETEI